jgi:hypothetical protein
MRDSRRRGRAAGLIQHFAAGFVSTGRRYREMMEIELARERQEAIRRMVADARLAARVPREHRLRRRIGTRLARLAVRLAGASAVRAAMAEAR